MIREDAVKTLDNILLLGRPAAGKSELIDFLKKTPETERAEAFHIGRFEELDDFVWLWEKFKEDDLWEEAGCGRLYTHRDGNNIGLEPAGAKLLYLMLARFNKEYREKYLDNAEFYDNGTLFVEFSRGMDHGYKKAFPRLTKEIYERAAILYVKVSFEESWRRNVKRYEEKLKHSILAHMATRKAIESFYMTDDWEEITSGRPEGRLELNGASVPFVTMNNEPELTERGPLTERYRPALDRLIDLYTRK